MKAEPYPDLDEDLYDVVRAINADFHIPPHLLPAAEFRAMVEELSSRSTFICPDGITLSDWTCQHGPRPVRVRFYLPRAWTSLTVYMHGGGWTVGSIEGHDQVCADLAEQSGCAVASVDYALSPELCYPAALEDCLAVYEALLAGDAPLPHAPSEMIVGGDSCGANLALALSLKRRDAGLSIPDALALIYPCTEPDFSRPSYHTHHDAPFLTTPLMKAFWRNYLGEDMAQDAYSCPARADFADMPPSLVLTAALDPLVDEGDDLAVQLTAAGIEVRHHRAEHLIHGFLRFRGSSKRARTAFGWLTSNLTEMIATLKEQ